MALAVTAMAIGYVCAFLLGRASSRVYPRKHSVLPHTETTRPPPSEEETPKPDPELVTCFAGQKDYYHELGFKARVIGHD